MSMSEEVLEKRKVSFLYLVIKGRIGSNLENISSWSEILVRKTW